ASVSQAGSVTPFKLAHGGFTQLQFKAGAKITSNTPISVIQIAAAGSVSGVSDPYMMQIVPTSHWRLSHRFNVPIDPFFAFSPNYAVITAPNSAVGSVMLNGKAVSGFAPLP